MKFKLIIASLALVISQAGLATPLSQPSSCPTIPALKNVGVSNITLDAHDGAYGVEAKNTFGTQDEWTFWVGPFVSNFKSEVLADANASLSDLVLQYGPEKDSDHFYCLYTSVNNPGIFAFTLTPTVPVDSAKLSTFIAKNIAKIKSR